MTLNPNTTIFTFSEECSWMTTFPFLVFGIVFTLFFIAFPQISSLLGVADDDKQQQQQQDPQAEANSMSFTWRQRYNLLMILYGWIGLVITYPVLCVRGPLLAYVIIFLVLVLLVICINPGKAVSKEVKAGEANIYKDCQGAISSKCAWLGKAHGVLAFFSFTALLVVVGLVTFNTGPRTGNAADILTWIFAIFSVIFYVRMCWVWWWCGWIRIVSWYEIAYALSATWAVTVGIPEGVLVPAAS